VAPRNRRDSGWVSTCSRVGEDNVHTDIFERINYADTSLPYDVEEGDLPDVVVQPANAQEISNVLKIANTYKIPVTTYGSGTSLIFGTKPKHRGITLSTERLDFFRIDEDHQWFECGAGVKAGHAIKELGKLGYFLPIQTQAWYCPQERSLRRGPSVLDAQRGGI
jgi:glycolate oxidase